MVRSGLFLPVLALTCHAVQKAEIGSTIPEATTTTFTQPQATLTTVDANGGERGIAAELEEAGEQVMRELQETQRELIDGLDLKS